MIKLLLAWKLSNAKVAIRLRVLRMPRRLQTLLGHFSGRQLRHWRHVRGM